MYNNPDKDYPGQLFFYACVPSEQGHKRANDT
jgi:hypothetical protein